MNWNKPNGVMMATLAALLLATSSIAERAVDQTRTIDVNATVSVGNTAGSIVVTGWDRGEIRITGTLSDQAKRLDIDGNERRLDIEVVLEDGRHHNIEGSHLEISLPRGCRIDLEGISADITVSGMTDEVDAGSVSGDIRVEGDLKEVGAESVSGDVELRVKCESIEASSVSGALDIRDSRAEECDAGSISGNVELMNLEARELEVECISGRIDFEGRILAGGTLSMGSQSGDIRLKLDRDLDAEFRISTFSGDI